MATVSKKKQLTNKKRIYKRVPKELIYEMRKGSPIYYRDYDKVLKGELPIEVVRASSGLRVWLLSILMDVLVENLEPKFEVLSNEVGYKFAPRSWYNLDIAVWDKEKVKPYLKQEKLVPVAPKVVIEVYTKADLRKFDNPQDYFHRKTQDLLNAGVEKVIWIFTKDKKVWIAEQKKPWLIVDWDYEIPVMDKIKINIEKLIKEEE